MIEWLMQLPVWVQALFATLFTWLMTALGAAFVFISGKFNTKVLNGMQGTAAGIMIAASFFSLLLPAAERLESSGNSATTALILSGGFLLGCALGELRPSYSLWRVTRLIASSLYSISLKARASRYKPRWVIKLRYWPY